LQFEVYDAQKGKPQQAAAAPTSPTSSGATAAGGEKGTKAQGETIRVLTSVEFMQNDVKVYESKPIVATEVSVPQRKAVVFQLDLPLQAFKPGFYTCQVNIIDDVAGNYAFPRWAMLIKEPASTPAAAPAVTGTSK